MRKFIRIYNPILLFFILVGSVLISSCNLFSGPKESTDEYELVDLTDEEINELDATDSLSTASFPFGLASRGQSRKTWRKIFKEIFESDAFTKRTVYFGEGTAYNIGHVIDKNRSLYGRLNEDYGFNEDDVARIIDQKQNGQETVFNASDTIDLNLLINTNKIPLSNTDIELIFDRAKTTSVTIEDWKVGVVDLTLLENSLKTEANKELYRNSLFKKINNKLVKRYLIERGIYIKGVSYKIELKGELSASLKQKLEDADSNAKENSLKIKYAGGNIIELKSDESFLVFAQLKKNKKI